MFFFFLTSKQVSGKFILNASFVPQVAEDSLRMLQSKQHKGNHRCLFLLCFLPEQVLHPAHVQQVLYRHKLYEVDPRPAICCACPKDTCIGGINALFLIGNRLLKTSGTLYFFKSLALHHKSLLIH